MAEETKTIEEQLAESQKALEAANADVEKWKAHSRKHEGRAAENATAAQQLKDAQDAQKTAEQRAVEKSAELEARLDKADARAMRAEVAAAKQLTPAQAKRLQGATPEELEADADAMIEEFKPKPAATEGEPETGASKTGQIGRPTEALHGGASSTSDSPDTRSVKDVLAEIPR